MSTRPHIKAHRRHERHPPRKFAISLYKTKISLASSGHSSPNSSITSPIFSSNGSSSSRSPVSSQNSFTEGSPYPSHLFRRQPRIQVASLLADPFTRLVISLPSIINLTPTLQNLPPRGHSTPTKNSRVWASQPFSSPADSADYCATYCQGPLRELRCTVSHCDASNCVPSALVNI